MIAADQSRRLTDCREPAGVIWLIDNPVFGRSSDFDLTSTVPVHKPIASPKKPFSKL
ncbi:hypothetical protein Nizo1840_2615 [Lactiplantibacillus plantarum]|nr:hypothetical protein Nizo1840_2615 [Lactiplantibacillus plantarum]